MRTVITGMGIWSCIGEDVHTVEQSLRTRCAGIGTDYRRTEYGYQSPLTGIVLRPDLKAEHLKRAQRTCMGEPAEYAYMAVKQALAQSGITDLHHCGLIVSNDSTANALAETEEIMHLHHDSRHLGAGMVFRTLNSTVSMSLASIFGIGGLTLTVSAACAGGGHAIGLAHSLIKSGILDCCIVVGAQEVGLHAYTSFDALGVFSRRTDDPAAASRPFDVSRDGLVPSGGAAAVILESEAHAAQGCRRPMASIDGYGFSTSPNIISPSADSIFRSMTNALKDANLTPADIDMIAAHATGTRDGDNAEAEAITSLSLFAPVPAGTPSRPYVVSTKCYTGHECWMSGVSQVVYTLIQMQERFIAPHINLTQPDKAAEQLRIPTTLVDNVTIRHALCNAFGFGGTNASLILSLWKE